MVDFFHNGMSHGFLTKGSISLGERDVAGSMSFTDTSVMLRGGTMGWSRLTNCDVSGDSGTIASCVFERCRLYLRRNVVFEANILDDASTLTWMDPTVPAPASPS